MTLAELTPLQAESMSMSIWLKSDGLTFSIEQEAEKTQPLITGQLPTPSGYTSRLEAIQELIYQHEWLCYPYQRVYLYYVPLRSVLIPQELYESQHANLWLEGICTLEDALVLAEPLPLESKVLLTATDRALINLFERIHPPLLPRPYYLPLILTQRQETRRQGNKVLLVSLRGAQLDCIGLNAGSLSYINHYDICAMHGLRSVPEMMYYILGLWQTLQMNLTADELVLVPENQEEPGELTTLAEELAAYITHIELTSSYTL